MKLVETGGTVVLAWVDFQARSQALAEAMGGRVRFVTRSASMRRPYLLPLRYVVNAVETWRLLSRERPHTVIVITPPVFAPLVAWAWCRLNGARIAMDCHTAAFDHKWAWTRPIHRWLAARMAAVMGHTDDAVSVMRAWTPTALLLPDDVPDGSAVNAGLYPRATHAPARGRVVIAGGLNAEEPVVESIEAARLLPDVEFLFTGDPDNVSADVVSGAPSNAIFTGWLQYPRFLAALANSDVVATFSVGPHMMNRAAFEAVGLGRALVLSDYPGLRSRFGDAAVYCPNDPAAMAAAIDCALRDRPRLEQLSEATGVRLQASRDAALRWLKVLVA